MRKQVQPGLIPWLQFDNKHWEAVSGQGVQITYPVGKVIEPEKQGELIYITKGEIVLSMKDGSGREKLLMVLGPGSLLGECSLYDGLGGNIRLFLVVEEEIRASRFSREKVLELIGSDPELMVEIVRSIHKKMQLVMQEIEKLAFSSTGQRLARFLYQISQSGAVPDLGKSIHKSLSHKYLAKVIGANRVTVSRLMADLKEKGLITIKEGQMQVPNPQKLLTYDFNNSSS